ERLADALLRRLPVERLQEADRGEARRVLGRVVEAAAILGEEIDAADEEREVGVRAAGDVTPVGPELRPARTVEGDHEELGRPHRRFCVASGMAPVRLA